MIIKASFPGSFAALRYQLKLAVKVEQKIASKRQNRIAFEKMGSNAAITLIYCKAVFSPLSRNKDKGGGMGFAVGWCGS